MGACHGRIYQLWSPHWVWTCPRCSPCSLLGSQLHHFRAHHISAEHDWNRHIERPRGIDFRKNTPIIPRHKQKVQEWRPHYVHSSWRVKIVILMLSSARIIQAANYSSGGLLFLVWLHGPRLIGWSSRFHRRIPEQPGSYKIECKTLKAVHALPGKTSIFNLRVPFRNQDRQDFLTYWSFRAKDQRLKETGAWSPTE